MSRVDPVFRNVARDKAGFYIWRIENLKVVSVPKDQYGKFYKGDSYIVLSIKDVKGRLEANIHFWLGSETTQDEAGAAAIKAVELDDHLDGYPTQHREVEAHESQQFINYFRGRGLEYKMGGVKSGFNHMEHKFTNRVLRIKGKRSVVATELPLTWTSFNHGDAFIVETMSVIFVWNGQESSRVEKRQALSRARELRDGRGAHARANIVVVEDGEELEMTNAEKKILEDSGLKLKDLDSIQAKETAGADTEVETLKKDIKLYCMREEDDTLTITEVKAGPLKYSDLDPSDAFIVDNNRNGVWLWVGKLASQKERKEGMRRLMGFIQKKGMPSTTQVKTTCQDAEPADFKWLFGDWPAAKYTGKVFKRDKIARQVQTKFDASTLHSNPQLAAETQMPDDGSGRVEVWRVEGSELVPQEKKYMGEFFGGDSYVIHYSYRGNRGKDTHILYYWLGMHSPPIEQGVAARKVVELDDQLMAEKGEDAVQVRVVQGKETAHFMSMFDGKMIIFSGGTASGNQRKENEKGPNGPGDRYMLQVRGRDILKTQAVQVPLRGASLNSNDVFVIITKTSVTIWCGKGSTGDEREMAKKICQKFPRSHTMVFEGQEKDDFWTMIGGKEAYSSDKKLQNTDNVKPPRLFQVSNAKGWLDVQEIPEFDQTDLIEDDVMILDVWDSLYIWIGKGANAEEKKGAVKIALEYLRSDPSERDESTPVLSIKQGCEPLTFTGFFGAWDWDIWSKGQTYEEMVRDAKDKNELLADKIEASSLANGAENFDTVPKFPLEVLQQTTVPEGIDPTCKEIHLETDVFESVFEMTYTNFQSLPPWKQRQLKIKHKLF